MLNKCMFRHCSHLYCTFSIQPVSQVLSSQVTNISDTSPDLAVQLTLQYSLVSSFYYYINKILVIFFCRIIQLLILCLYVAFGIFHYMREGL